MSDRVRQKRVERQTRKSVQLLEGGKVAKFSRLVREGKADFSQKPVADAYIGVYAREHGFSDHNVQELAKTTGLSVEEIAENKDVRDFTVKAFREIVVDVIDEDDRVANSSMRVGLGLDESRYERRIYSDNLLSFDYLHGLRRHDEYGGIAMSFSMDVLEKMAENEEDIKKLTEGIDLERFGDILVARTLETLAIRYYGNDDEEREELEKASRSLAFLKKLGYEPDFGRKDAYYYDIDSLFWANDGSIQSINVMQRRAEAIGLIDEKVVGQMYDRQLERFQEFIRGERGTYVPNCYIRGGLRWSGESKYAEKMQGYSRKFSRAAMDNIVGLAREVYQSDLKRARENGEEMYDVSELLGDGGLGVRFFESTIVRRKAFKGEADFWDGEVLRELYADNMEAVGEGEDSKHILGVIKTWNSIRDDNGEPDAGKRESFVRFVADEYHDNDMWRYVGDDDKFEKMFDENGVTERFYEKLLIYPKYVDFIECIDENWRGHYNDAENAYMDFKKNKDLFDYIVRGGYLYSGREAINKFFDKGGPNEFLVNVIFESDSFSGLAGYPELLERLPNGAERFSEKLFERGYFDTLAEHPELWERLPDGGVGRLAEKFFEIGKFDVMMEHSEVFEGVLDDKQKKIIECIASMDWRIKDVCMGLFRDGGYEDFTIEGIEAMGDVLQRLTMSNADEIASHPEMFARWALHDFNGDPDELRDRLEKIEDIFVHNNLPFVGKVFNTFLTVFPLDSLRTANRGQLEGLAEGEKRKILWNDLLKAAVGSNNKSLREYLESLQEGSALAEKVLSEDVPESEFSDDEIGVLNEYAEYLETLYANTERGKQEKEPISMSVFEKVRLYSLKFSAEERRKIPDIIVRSFASGLGFRTAQELIAYMDEAASNADGRNREAASKDEFRLESGDLIKAVSVEFLGDILQNGSVCKEFLNGQANSDGTPLDADLGVLGPGLSGDIAEGVDHKNANNVFGTMHCMLVMKGDGNDGGRDRFSFESEGGEYAPWQYEVWENGGENHGIRVGFPSTEIDYIIFDRLGGDAHGDLERVKFEIARNGIYIPVVDKDSGRVVFSPEGYDVMRRDIMGGLAEYGGAPYVFADERGVVAEMALPEFRVAGGDVIPGTAELMAGAERNREEVNEKRQAIVSQIFIPVLEEAGLMYSGEVSSNLLRGIAEIIDTGSTGRYSNAPGDGDFDFMMKLDREIQMGDGLIAIREELLDRMGLSDPAQRAGVIANGNIRAKNVRIEGLAEPVDIDVTFARRTSRVDYSTDMALAEYYQAMRAQSEEKAAEVVANVVYAKKFLKAHDVYKPNRGEKPQGGLGGVGVENWIVQNGGSFVAAARGFVRVADECRDDFGLFRERYGVFDLGENHKADARAAHDNFVVSNMSAEGFAKMVGALRGFLGYIGG